MADNVIAIKAQKTRGAERASSAAAGFDPVPFLVIPGVLFLFALFVYPFLYGLFLSLHPADGDMMKNYRTFFDDPRLWRTIPTTLWIALPSTLINIGLALPIAYRMRRPIPNQRLLTIILVVPITLGTVLVAEGLLSYLGPIGWFNRVLMTLHLISEPLHLTHNYWGVMLSMVITGFPFAFLLILSFVTGIDPSLGHAAATLGASSAAQFWRIYLPLLTPGLAMTFCLVFVQGFSVFPSAVLLGAPAGPTRVISIAAYQAAFEDYDYAMASAIAMIMGGVQLIVIVAVLVLRGQLYRGPATGGKA